MEVNMIWYVGDLHGEAEDLERVHKNATEQGIEYIVQVGDFGCRWPGRPCPMFEFFQRIEQSGTTDGPIWITCGGNHDNWTKWFHLSRKQEYPDLVEIAPGCFFAQRGAVIEIEGKTHLFLGGAESTDRHHRKEGQSWWATETPTYAEFGLFSDRLNTEKPDIVITHDAPLRVPYDRRGRESNPTPRNLENIIKLSDHKPKYWYYGHHHTLQRDEIDGTIYQCCGLRGQYVEG